MPLVTIVTEIVRLTVRGDGTLAEDKSAFIPVTAYYDGEEHKTLMYIARNEIDEEDDYNAMTMESIDDAFNKDSHGKLEAFIHSQKEGTTRQTSEKLSGGSALAIEMDYPLLERLAWPCGHVLITFALTFDASVLPLFMEASTSQVRDTYFDPLVDCHCCSNQQLKKDFAWHNSANHMNLLRGPFLERVDGPLGTDFTIVTSDHQELHVHKLVLASASDPLANLVSVNLLENRTGRAEITDISSESMRLFLRVLYNRASFFDYRLSCRALLHIHKVADKYGVQNIIDLCNEAWGMAPITAQCFFDCLEFAYDLNLPALKRRVAEAAVTFGRNIWKDKPLSLSQKSLDLAMELIQELTEVKKS